VYVDTGGIHSEKSPIPGYIYKLMPIKCPYPCLCKWTDNECMNVYILLNPMVTLIIDEIGCLE
jgi:hypothetical protein